MAQGSKSKTTATGKSRKGSTGRSGTSAKKQETYEEEGLPAFLGPEVMIILSFMAAVLLFLSNFHLCGVVGDFLRRLQLGLFGVVGYILPFFLFIGTSFYMANRGNRKAVIKLAAVTGGLLAICGLAQMIFGAALEPGGSLLSFYQLSSEGKGGGLIGGGLSFGLQSVVGSIGAYLILLAVLIICGVCITEKSVVNVVKTGSGRAYQYAKEDAIRRKEEREERLEERRRLREDNVVRGVDFGSITFQDPNVPSAPGGGTGMPQGQEPGNSASGERPASRKRSRIKESPREPAYSSADVFTGRIDIPPEYEEPVPFAEDMPGQGAWNGQGGMPGAEGWNGQGGMSGAEGWNGQGAMPGAEGWNGQDGMPGAEGWNGQGGMSGAEGWNGQAGMYGAGGASELRETGGASMEISSAESRPKAGQGEEKVLSFSKKAGKRKDGPLYADRELMTMEELDDTLPVPALPGEEPASESFEGMQSQLGKTAMEAGTDFDGSITFQEEHSKDELRGGVSWDFFAEDPLPQTDSVNPGTASQLTAASNGLEKPEQWAGPSGDLDPMGQIQNADAPEAVRQSQSAGDLKPARQLQHASEPNPALQLQSASEPNPALQLQPTGDPDPMLHGRVADPLASGNQDRPSSLHQSHAGTVPSSQSGPVPWDEPDSPQSIYVPEGEKRVVTANGKIIETETELLHKRIESRREEAAQERPEAALRASGKAPEPVKKPYVFPPTSLLKKGSRAAGAFSEDEYKETAIKLQQTLRNFGVGVTVTNISCGPSVTRYELHPEQGVKVSRIVGLADDIKLSLAAAEIRIEAPIPGKSAVGIEVPNKETSMVYLRELLESEGFVNSKSRLTFAGGKDIGGQPVTADIGKMPHLLIAGATGSGKSVCINTLIMSIIFKADPEDVKLIMVDPKVVELSVYNGIPHLMIPVVTDPKKASGALNWAVAEMGDRYKKFAEYNVRDLKGYNEKIKNLTNIPEENRPKKLPQIVIIIDELADLMMVVPGEVEDAICRLAQLARAAGIHLVIATQRPSVNVITGLIKANVPSRIAFSVSSGVDSRTIIDMNGAEKLLGKGDMLFYPSGVPKPQRVQGAFVSDQEVSQVVEFLTEQGLTTSYSSEVESRVMNSTLDGFSGGGNSRGEDFAQAGRFIIEKEKASIGMLQRMFKIGFNRAARIMDQLAEAGVVGEEEGTKPRKLLMTMEEFEQFLSGGN